MCQEKYDYYTNSTDNRVTIDLSAPSIIRSAPSIITPVSVLSIDLPVTEIKPSSIVTESKMKFRSEELYVYDSIYFLGFARMRNLIEKNKMNSEDYLFAYQKKTNGNSL